jgi:hypothetical protein
MVMGDNSAELYWGIWLLDEGRWALGEGGVPWRDCYSMAFEQVKLMVAGGDRRPFEPRPFETVGVRACGECATPPPAHTPNCSRNPDRCPNITAGPTAEHRWIGYGGDTRLVMCDFCLAVRPAAVLAARGEPIYASKSEALLPESLSHLSADKTLPVASQIRLLEQKQMYLADECQTLRDENTHLLAENARLRREIGRGKRGPKR